MLSIFDCSFSKAFMYASVASTDDSKERENLFIFCVVLFQSSFPLLYANICCKESNVTPLLPTTRPFPFPKLALLKFFAISENKLEVAVVINSFGNVTFLNVSRKFFAFCILPEGFAGCDFPHILLLLLLIAPFLIILRTY